MTGKLYYWVANWNLSRAEAALRLGNDVWNMVDCTHDHVNTCSQTTAEVMAGYVTGTPDIRWTPEDWKQADKQPVPRILIRIDQSNSDLPLIADTTLTKDIEPGASGNPVAVEVAKQRLHAGDNYMLYVSQANLPALEHAIAAAGLPHGEIVAYQYASPESNPNTLLPGTRLTIKEVNADLSVIKRGIYPVPSHAQPSPAHRHSLARAHVYGVGASGGVLEFDLRTLEWRSLSSGLKVEPAPWGDQ